ncbi:hypothetical protein PBRA_007489 [Plasmodiophora brassicae]|uniref:Uncharacterized protein n=1 Tax=Plasmodiophora brassicae TaxID=37360 RepID=A0A0G4IWS5_PLABS|nr:hypothetical protein PBRA_007489 [Plasmodiophora brassicae]
MPAGSDASNHLLGLLTTLTSWMPKHHVVSVCLVLVGSTAAGLDSFTAVRSSEAIRKLTNSHAFRNGSIPLPLNISVEQHSMLMRYAKRGILPSDDDRRDVFLMMIVAHHLNMEDVLDRLADAVGRQLAVDVPCLSICSSLHVSNYLVDSTSRVRVRLPDPLIADITARIATKNFRNKCLTSLIKTSQCNGRDLWGHLSRVWFVDTIVSLRTVDLSGNNIETVADRAFTGFANLVNLFVAATVVRTGQLACMCRYLQRNQIRLIQQGAFYGLSMVTNLRLSSNRIKSIESGMFSGLQSLTTLHLNDNHIRSLGNTAFDGTLSLTKLWLENNYILMIKNGSFKRISTLSFLWLENNRISSIEGGAFDELPRLSKLSLAGNHILTIENGVFSALSSLNALWLDRNWIQSIQDNAFYGMSSLMELHLQNNHVQFIAKDMFHALSSLLFLNLASNQIQGIQSGAFAGLSSLQYLNLETNHIQSIQRGAFHGRCSVLVKNRIRTIKRDAFNGLPSLTKLSLRLNKIESIEKGAFTDLTSLAFLDLSKNHIERIDSGALTELPSLTEL